MNKIHTHGKVYPCFYCGTNCQILINGNPHCKKHSRQVKLRGKTYHARKDGNKIVKRKNYCEVYLYDNFGNIKAKTKIDNEDVDKVSKLRWGLLPNLYVYNRKNKLYLHRYLINNNSKNRSIVTDHINRDKLDNRKKNLRIVNQSTNAYNNKSKGMHYRKKTKNWEVYVGKKYIGRFKTKKEALSVRKQLLSKILNNKKGAGIFSYLFWVIVGIVLGAIGTIKWWCPY